MNGVWKRGEWGVLRHGDPEQKPHPFWDSDIGKMIKGAACALILHPDPELENKIDRVIEQMEQLQEPDGYLNSYFQAAEPKSERFRNLYYMHELYCAGHLMEGAVAWYEATGKRRFLDLMIRYADLLVETFSDSGKARAGYCGHPEIEPALVRLYRVTEDRRYLDPAWCFLDRRGTEPYYFEQESLAGGDTTKTANQKRHLKDFLPSRGPYAEYQAHCLVRSQKEPVGHVVRAMYLYSGMADVANACEDQELLEACRTLWDRADRMLQLEADAKYADILEQTLYNIIFGSVSEDGERFFYANYLSVYPPFYRHAGKVLNDKRYAVCQLWFQVSCCPPNICRLLGSMGDRIASVSDGAVWIHQYTECRIDTCMNGQPLVLRMETGYPWDGRIVMTLGTACPVTGRILLRIPGWCGKYRLCVNHEEPVSIRAVPYFLWGNRGFSEMQVWTRVNGL